MFVGILETLTHVCSGRVGGCGVDVFELGGSYVFLLWRVLAEFVFGVLIEVVNLVEFFLAFHIQI